MNETDRLSILMGKTPEEATAWLESAGYSRRRILYTRDPRSRCDDESMEKRVIRIREKEGFLELLVGFFSPAAFSKQDSHTIY